jgi:hypothetical protein
MATNPYSIRSLGGLARDLGIAAALFATIGLAPAAASAGDVTARAAMAPGSTEQVASASELTASGLLASVDSDRIVLHRSAAPDLQLSVDGGTYVAVDGQSASVSSLRSGQEVRASYQESNGVARAIEIQAQNGQGQPVRSMSPNDPEWGQTHQGG